MLTYKTKTISVVATALIAIILLMVLVVRPALNDISEMKNIILKDKQDQEAKFQRDQILKTMLTDYKTLDSEKQKIDMVFITEGEEIAFVTDLEKIAESLGLEDPHLSKLVSDKKAGAAVAIQELPLKLEVRGNYTRILQYIAGIENLPYYFNIDSVVIQGDGNDSQGNVVATLDGTVFIKKQK